MVFVTISAALFLAQLIMTYKFFYVTREVKEVGYLPRFMTILANVIALSKMLGGMFMHKFG